MSKWQTPVTDRTLSDVLSRTAKGFLNILDWVRIYGNSEQILAITRIMHELDIPFTELAEPSITSIPTVGEINSLVENIDQLRAESYLPAITGLVALKYDYVAGSGAVAPDYLAVNQWEQDLLILREMLVNAAEYFIYCGVASAGQVRFWQVRFRTWPNYVPAAATPVRRPRCGIVSSGTVLTRQNSWRQYE